MGLGRPKPVKDPLVVYGSQPLVEVDIGLDIDISVPPMPLHRHRQNHSASCTQPLEIKLIFPQKFCVRFTRYVLIIFSKRECFKQNYPYNLPAVSI